MKITWSTLARADEHRIWMFTAERDVQRADRIEAQLEDSLATLSGVPRQGRPVGDGIRQLSLPEIQLVVQYRIVEDENAIRILRVWHTRENRS